MDSRLAQLAAGFAIAAALAACGGDDGSAPAPAPTPTPSPAPAPLPSTTALTATVPASGSVAVGVRAPLSLDFNGALDPTSVTGEHVQLVTNGFPVAATVAYDDARHAITVTPALPMVDGRPYVLRISGLLDAHGRAIVATLARFRTAYDPVVPDGYTAADALQYDATGREIRVADGDGAYQAFTYNADDTLAAHQYCLVAADPGNGTDICYQAITYAYDANGTLLSATTTSTSIPSLGIYAGPPYRETYDYDAAGNVRLVTLRDPGVDKVLDTPDDLLQFRVSTFDAQGRPLHVDVGTQLALDGTIADPRSSYSTFAYGDDGQPDQQLDVGDPGDDDTWLTADDRATGRTDTYHDADGNVVQVVRYAVDYRTGQLAVHSYTTYAVDANGNRLTSTDYLDPGDDGRWMTADDIAVGTAYDASH